MRAGRIHRHGGSEVLDFEEEVTDPAVDDDTVLIGTIATSDNPIAQKIRSGERQRDFPLALSAILGKDVSDTVLAVGAEVRHVAVGDRVIALADATYAEKVAVPSALITHLPDGVDPLDAAALPLAVLTGDQLVRLATRVPAGQAILVSGALGSVGRAAVHSALNQGSPSSRACARGRQRRQRASVHRRPSIDDEAALTTLVDIDVVADTVGGSTAARLLAEVRAGGRFGYASVLPEGAAKDHSVEITRVFARPNTSKLCKFADDVRDGRFALPVSRYMPLADARAAHELLEKGGRGKVVLTIQVAMFQLLQESGSGDLAAQTSRGLYL